MQALVAGRSHSDNRCMSDDYRPEEYWTERLTSDFNLRGTGHICFSEGYNRWLYRAKRRVLRRALHGLQAPMHALDIGSGVGWVVDQLLAAGASVEGCDVAEVAVERLRASHPNATFFVAAWGTAPISRPDQSYDVVTLLDVAYHVVDDDRWAVGVRDAARLLRPGGRLIVTDSLGRDDAAPAPHVRFRSRARWERTARDAGLELVTVMRYVAWLSRDRDAVGFGRMSDNVRGAVEYLLEVVAPRPAHLRGAVFVRQR
jgi:SAM-dependent methyltransferase